MIFDLHLHTTKGGADSSLTPDELVQEAKRVGLDGVCITEHSGNWDKRELKRLGRENGLVIIRGMEVATDLGHVAVFGLDSYVSGIRQADKLHRIIRGSGGFSIALHPFRRIFDPDYTRMEALRAKPPTLEEAIHLPLFRYVDTMEVLNGACTEQENLFSLLVARQLGKKGTGGSDAHSTHGLGCFVTVFDNEIKNEADLIKEMRAGHYHPARGLLDGELTPFSVSDEDLMGDPRLINLL
jgi:hypothetical protein